MQILQKHYKKLALCIAFLIFVWLTYCCGNQKDIIQPQITVDKISSNDYVIKIVDNGYNKKLPIKVKVYFSIVGNKAVLNEKNPFECESTEQYEYVSVIPYINKEESEQVYFSLLISNVNRYSYTGKFLDRVDFEYKLNFRVNLKSLEIVLLDE